MGSRTAPICAKHPCFHVEHTITRKKKRLRSRWNVMRSEEIGNLRHVGAIIELQERFPPIRLLQIVCTFENVLQLRSGSQTSHVAEYFDAVVNEFGIFVPKPDFEVIFQFQQRIGRRGIQVDHFRYRQRPEPGINDSVGRFVALKKEKVVIAGFDSESRTTAGDVTPSNSTSAATAFSL